MPENNKDKITATEAGKKGGLKTLETHGSSYYAKIGKMGGSKLLKEKGPEYYSEIGKKGAQRLRELVKKGREVEKVQLKNR